MSTKEPNLQESNVRQVQAQLDEFIASIKDALPEDPCADNIGVYNLGKVRGLEIARDTLENMWQIVEILHENRRIGA